MTGSMSLLAFAIALAAAPSSAPAAFDVRGSTTCPGPELVAEHLRPLLPADAKLPAGAHIEVADVPATVGAEAEIEIRLVDGASAVALASRRLQKPSSCAEAAEGLAVVAATWAARYHAVSPGAPPLLEPQVPAPPPVLVRAARPAAPSVIVSMGASAGIVTASRGGSAPFAAIAVEGRGAGRPWAVRLSFAAVGERTLALSPGVVAWNRLTASPEVAWTWGTPSAFAQVGLGALAGVSFVSGRGIQPGRTRGQPGPGRSALGPGWRTAGRVSRDAVAGRRVAVLATRATRAGGRLTRDDRLASHGSRPGRWPVVDPGSRWRPRSLKQSLIR